MSIPTDGERINILQELLVGADFSWGEPRQCVVVFELPAGVSIGNDVRKYLDDVAAIRVPTLKAETDERYTGEEKKA